MPMVSTATIRGRMPKYREPTIANAHLDGLATKNVSFGMHDLCICTAFAVPDAVHSLMLAEPDVISAPDTSQTISDIVTFSALLEAAGLPADWISSTLTYDEVFRRLSNAFQFAQRYHGLYVAKLIPAGVTLDTQFSDLPTNLRQQLRDTAATFSYDATELSGTTKLRRVLMAMAEQWVDTPPPAGPSSLSDNFNRANEDPIAGNWTNEAGTFKIVTNTVRVSTLGLNSNVLARWNANSWNATQTSKATIGNLQASKFVGVAARVATGAQTGYDHQTDGGATTYLRKVIAGTATNLSTGSTAYVNGDTVKIDTTNTTITAYRNDSTTNAPAAASDSSISSGSSGLAGNGGPTGQQSTLDDWIGTGEIVALEEGFWQPPIVVAAETCVSVY